MLTYAIAFFALAAIGGLIMATRLLRGQLAPWPLSILHALLGATGLGLLVLGLAEGLGGSLMPFALTLLIVAALGGFFLASLHARGVAAPKNIVIIHALAAISGFVLLLAAVFS